MNPAAGATPPRDELAEWFARPTFCIGEIFVRRTAEGGFDLRHRDDAAHENLTAEGNPETARDIALRDDAGKYRSLKTAPNLRHGWRLVLRDETETRLALDFFYPGRIASYLAHAGGRLVTTSLRETLERQTGMYRAAANVTAGQADDMVGRFCRSADGCLRTILWQQDRAGTAASSLLPAEKFDPAHDQTGRGEPTIPLLCQEACNLLVAEARRVVKGE